MNRLGVCLCCAAVGAAACGNQANPAPSDTSQGNAGAPAGANGSGGTVAFGGAANDLSSGGSRTQLPPTGGTHTADSAGGASSGAGGTFANGTTARATGGSLGCGGTLTLGSITPAELHTELAQGARTFLLVNVHVPVAGHIPGTDADIDYRNVADIEQFLGADKSQPAVIYCMSDHMSDIAGPELVADGYCHVRALAGGMNAWSNAGYTVEP